MQNPEKSLRVLIVEDEFIIADEIASIVEGVGHSIIGPAGTVDEAMSILEGGNPDFAIIDANLRGESSSPLAHRLSELHVPFCVCTGYRIDDLRSTFGEVPVVQKPVRARTLLQILAAATARPDGSG
jgi:two-component system, response regulator PdtaR